MTTSCTSRSTTALTSDPAYVTSISVRISVNADTPPSVVLADSVPVSSWAWFSPRFPMSSRRMVSWTRVSFSGGRYLVSARIAIASMIRPPGSARPEGPETGSSGGAFAAARPPPRPRPPGCGRRPCRGPCGDPSPRSSRRGPGPRCPMTARPARRPRPGAPPRPRCRRPRVSRGWWCRHSVPTTSMRSTLPATHRPDRHTRPQGRR